ncbi:hypothetical protein JOM56_012000 [Amanita muscaria]
MFDKGQEGLDSATTNTTTSTHESHPQHRPDSDGEFSLYSVRNLDEMDSEANSHLGMNKGTAYPQGKGKGFGRGGRGYTLDLFGG